MNDKLELYYDTPETFAYMAKIKKAMVELDSIYDSKVREEAFRNIFKKLGKNPSIMHGFRCEYGNIEVGDNVLINMDCCFLDSGGIILGDNVWIAPRTCLFTIGHPVATQARADKACLVAPVKIGDNVWIGGNVTINPGVTIGENTVIGSGSVVTHDIPAGVVAAGNPCKVIRQVSYQDELDYIEYKERMNQSILNGNDVLSRILPKGE